MTDGVLIERMHKAIEKGHKAVEQDFHKDKHVCEWMYFYNGIMSAAADHDPERIDELISECYFLGVYRGLDKRKR